MKLWEVDWWVSQDIIRFWEMDDKLFRPSSCSERWIDEFLRACHHHAVRTGLISVNRMPSSWWLGRSHQRQLVWTLSSERWVNISHGRKQWSVSRALQALPDDINLWEMDWPCKSKTCVSWSTSVCEDVTLCEIMNILRSWPKRVSHQEYLDSTMCICRRLCLASSVVGHNSSNWSCLQL